MRLEKKQISAEYLERLQSSPYFVVVDYNGLKVNQFAELRSRLSMAGGEVHVVKNSIFKIAAAEAGIEDLGEPLRGQIAIVVGDQEISVAAKALKNFAEEFEKPTILFGFMGTERLDADGIRRIADLPPLDQLRAKLVGLINTPATQLATIIKTPARQLAQLLKAKSEKE
ncbi:MAG: 50S ribosomal protein L10 [Verrucomicrobia subdivision 3 bacterium]|nr:50S ribosomal protein L10 [Limisphaerales bacterium]MCS1416010.1 50S ribosomal protein L10 [Limisphaerales bacterium]